MNSSKNDNTFPTAYQQFVYKSRYSRYLPEENRREDWGETVERYLKFFDEHLLENHDFTIPKATRKTLENAISDLQVMPSMRALMTAGPALKRDNIAGFNCNYIVFDSPKAFDEEMYILMCFHPDTMVKTSSGSKTISSLTTNDIVLSFNEVIGKFEWKAVTMVIENNTANREKVRLTLENGSVFLCTADHKWLTSNRGWVEAQHLTEEDDMLAPKFEIYQITNTKNGKSYIGYTSKSAHKRFTQHMIESGDRYNSHFKNAIKKHGKKCWTLAVVDYAYTIVEAKSKETFHIERLDTKNAGYNSTAGGEGGGYKWTMAQRENAKKSAYIRTKEHKERQRKVLDQARVKIDKTRKSKKYRESAKIRNSGSGNPRFGYVYTDDEREQKRLEAAKRNRKQNGTFA